MRKINILSLCLISMVFASFGYADLVNRYSFNGNCNDSVGGNNGTLVNITGNSTYSGGMLVLGNTGVERTSGNIGNPDPVGNPWPLGDYIDLPNGTLHNAADSNAFTIEMWVRIDAEQDTEIALFDFGHSFVKTPGTAPGEVAGNQEYPYDANLVYGTEELFVDPDGKRTYFSPFAPGDDNLRWRWRNEANYQYPGIFPETQLITIPTTGTVHIVCSYKLEKFGSEENENWKLSASLYINGQLAGTATGGGNACDFSHWPDGTYPDNTNNGVDLNCWLGRSQQRYATYLQGAYDEVRIYNHALSAAEAAYNYNVGPNYYCDQRLAGDLNGDCFVNMNDFSMMYTHWLDQSPRKVVKDALIHRWKLNGNLEDSVGTADGTLVSEKPAQYEMADQYVALRHTWDETFNDLLNTTEPTKGTCIQLPNGLLTGLKNVTIEMFVTENDHRWDAQHFNFGANDQYWVKTSTWKKREAISGLSSEDSGCNPFFKFKSYIEEAPNETMQVWWHQDLGHWGQNLYLTPAMSDYNSGQYVVNHTHIAITVENDVAGIWNWTQNRPTQPGDPNTDSFGPGDRITVYTDGELADWKKAPGNIVDAIKVVPQHEGPNFHEAYVWDDTRGGTVTANGYLEEGEARGWKETANYIGRNGFKCNGSDARYYDFRIYNRALNASEIAQNFADGSEAEICNVAGDINADCVVDLKDFALLAKEWFLDAITY